MFAKVELIEQADGYIPSMPVRATAGSAGYDLSYAGLDDLVCIPGHTIIIPTGLKIALPVGCEAQIRSRSGLAAKNNVFVLNSPGTIDSDYRGEIKVIIMNLGPSLFVVRRGDRVAQMVIARYERPEFTLAALDQTDRADGGFGSTGTKAFDVT